MRSSRPMNDREADPERDDVAAQSRSTEPRGSSEGRAAEQTGRGDGESVGGSARRADTEAELADLRARVAVAQDLRLRALADLDNLRKRCAAQVRRAVEDAQAVVAAQWLPVVDNLERALDHAHAEPEAIIEGV